MPKGVSRLVKVQKFEDQVCVSLGTQPGLIEPEIINLPVYAGAALAELNKKFPGIDDIPQEDSHRMNADRAIIAATALKLLPYWVLNYAKIDQTPNAKVEMFEPDWDALYEHLKAEVATALENLDPDGAESAGHGFYGFRLTFGNGRGCG